MVKVSDGDSNKLGVNTPISVHIEMTGDSGPFVEVPNELDPDVVHGPPLNDWLLEIEQVLPFSPEYVLSQEIKEYEEYDDGETITNIVVSFNSNLLYSRCKPAYHMVYDASIDIDVLCVHFCVWMNGGIVGMI